MADALDVSDLDPAAVAQAEAFLVTFISEQYPALDLTEGRVLRNLLIRPAAMFYTLNSQNLSQLQRSQSLLEIEKDPALASDDAVDAVLSNFRITRNPGAPATGNITLVIQNLLTTPVAQNTVFTANGLTYTTTQAYVGVTTQDAVVSAQQRLITARNDGLYVFTVPVTATANSEAYNARKNTRFTVAPAPPGLVDAYAAQDFTGGRAAQTNQELVNEFKLAISPEVFSGRIQIVSLLQKQFPNSKAFSIIGFGDPEMLRDRNNIFSVSHGGKADIYARTQTLPELRTLTKTATLIDAAAQKWQISMLRDDAPGFYTVESILPTTAEPDQDSLEITAQSRGLDLSAPDGEFVPTISSLTEGAYSRYQTAVLQFIDPDVNTSGLVENSSTRDYAVTVQVMPNIKEMQELACSRASRNPQADYLVRAPIPAFTTVTLTVQYTDEAERPDADELKQAIADRVNGLNYTLGQLPASVIYDAAHDLLAKAGAMIVAPIDILCRIHLPSGTIQQLRSGNGITVPDLPDKETTSRTVIFYLDVEDVDVSIEKVALPQV